ncbi:acetate--CoA ligase family protein [Thermomonospora curvata]|mgnify:FL=1|uniref:CoA-binding domain protein n=1 Tax=Thermomonospora curvata (strain ATCC 19995 / DSM 43183 / JCM 3096 / KCTC 9072 / NBRC 15933 / NCIMB 10081 / Henssen B9) TaxID=471852 RepID=D1A2N2_THECD|nr:acetate--CoA ligase family protein [Thermomonospora curvata]ACY96052.1 CoA-binding domain protein [Thermomonospora curvata DSM 43183]
MSLSVFSDPASVAVVGASADPAKWGYWIARGALRGAHRREVHLVNAKGAVIEGVQSARSLSELPSAPELVVLTAPARTIPAVIDEALALGVKGFLGITAHIDAANGEAGLERRLAERIRRAGARIVGPNCLGLYDAGSELELAWGTFVPGSIAIVSQSGQLGLELAGLAAHAGLGVSRFVSIGNQVDVTAAELLEDLISHETTRTVVLYLENFGAGRELAAVMARLRQAGKHVIVLTVGASDAGRAAARSHTGAMTAATDVVAAACRAAGAAFVETPAQAIDLAHLLIDGPLPAGDRVAIVSDSGGQGAIAADTLSRHRLTVPALSEGTRAAVAALLPEGAGTANPIDLAGAGEQDLATYARLVDVLLGSGEVDTVVLSGYFGCYGADTPSLVDRELQVADAIAASAARHGRPVIVHSMSHDSQAVRRLRSRAVPTLFTIDAVARSLGIAAELARSAPADPARLAAPAAPLGDTGKALPYLAGRDLLAKAGLSYPRAIAVWTPEEAGTVARSMTGPFVLKAGWLEHKTELGGVAVGLPDADAVRAALADMISRLGEGDYVLEEMDTRTGAVELIVGARRDPAFGPVVLVGLGGVTAELYRDVALALAPVDVAEARRLLESLAGLPLLTGFRGRPAVDVDAVAESVVAVSRLIAEDGRVLECEVNPLRVGPDGAIAVDALVVAAAGDQPDW